MNHSEYLEAMSAIGYSTSVAESLVRLSKDPSDVALRTSNFVPRGDGLYEIWVSGDRDDFYRVSATNGETFVGTLSDAYGYVYEQTRQWREAQTRAEDDA